MLRPAVDERDGGCWGTTGMTSRLDDLVDGFAEPARLHEQTLSAASAPRDSAQLEPAGEILGGLESFVRLVAATGAGGGELEHRMPQTEVKRAACGGCRHGH